MDVVAQPAAHQLGELPRRPPALIASSVSKSFTLPHDRPGTLKEQVLHPLSRHGGEPLRALRDVSFEVAAGEFFGIVGRNGVGKSTLLKCLSGIYRLDAGEVAIAGRVAPFIELGVGFNPELSARDNALINAILLGLTPREAAARLDEILAFAELERFREMKLKNFSAGMSLRLAFAVTVQVDADVLMFDEVLAVGDAAFQSKCMEHFERLRAEGRTLLLVTHDMSQVQSACDRALLLEHGRVGALGPAAEVAEAYYESNARAAGGRRIQRPQRQSQDEPAREPRPAPPPARPLVSSTGPTVVGRRPGRLWTLVRTLAVAEFKLRYLDAALSYVWVLMGPLLFSGILYVVFEIIGGFNEGVAHYPLYLVTCILLWMFFANATSRAVNCMVGNEPLLSRLPFPHAAIPLSVVLQSVFDLVMSSVALLVFVLASGIAPTVSWLEVPVLFAGVVAFATGISFFLAAVYVRYRDIDQIWILLRQVLFYASGTFFVVTRIPHSLRPIFLANPLAAVFAQVRQALIDPHAPTVVQAVGIEGVLAPIGVTALACLIGAVVFWRLSPSSTENL